MSETKDTTGNATPPAAPGAAPARKPLTLSRKVDAGHIRQSFSHGKSKTVAVERKKSFKLPVPGSEGGGAAPQRVGNLSSSENESRMRALEANKQREAADAAKRAAEEATQRAEAEAARKAAELEARAEAPAVETTASEPSSAPESGAPSPAVAQPAAAPTPPASAPAVSPAPADRSSTMTASAPMATARAAQGPGPAGPRPQQSAGPAPTQAYQRPPPRPGDRPGDRGNDRGPPRTGDRPGSDRPPYRPAGDRGGPPSRGPGRPGDARGPAGAPPPALAGRAPNEVGPNRRTAAPSRAPTRDRDAGGTAEDEVRVVKKGGIKIFVKAPEKAPEEKKERGRLTINNALNENQRERSLASLRRRNEKIKLKAMGVQQARDKVMREVIVPEAISIQELANRMTERAVDIIKYLMKQGGMHKINDVIDADTAELIVSDFGHTVKRVSESDVLDGFIKAEVVDEEQEPRAPVVTIMGHVDHGKTSLLDAIRKTSVVDGEAGGITQHIGAYQVMTDSGAMITFIDTPGHEAFTAMRARGAKVTDIVILVVAADDGVMPQTIEAINHAKAAKVPIIVAINKIDKAGADPKRVRTELLQHEIVVESMGGDTLEVPVSATKGTNLEKLLETIALQAEVLQLKANPDRSAEGYVIEAKLERGRGPVGTVLVQRGTLEIGDIVVAGKAWGRVRALIDDLGDQVPEAGPSVPVEILGFDTAPEAGDQFAVVESEARAREITDYRIRKRRDTLGTATSSRTLEGMMQQLKDAGRKEFPMVVKGDVQGSVEAIAGALGKAGNDEVSARIVHSGVGQITESDVALASASKAIIVGFNVRANMQAKQLADQQGIEIRYYNIIYDLVDDVKGAMSGLLAPTKKETFLGYANIKKVFDISKQGKVAGCVISSGKVERGAKVRLLRERVVIHEGTLSILKRFKDDVKEVPAGQECGMAFANYQDIREGDEIECFTVEIIARKL
jgi:translation initiation factor IF-2